MTGQGSIQISGDPAYYVDARSRTGIVVNEDRLKLELDKLEQAGKTPGWEIPLPCLASAVPLVASSVLFFLDSKVLLGVIFVFLATAFATVFLVYGWQAFQTREKRKTSADDIFVNLMSGGTGIAE